MCVNAGVVEVKRGKDQIEDSFGPLQLRFQRFNVLGRGGAPSVGGLVIGALWKPLIWRWLAACGLVSHRMTYHNYTQCSACMAASLSVQVLSQ
jgi:hypothetical protein